MLKEEGHRDHVFLKGLVRSGDRFGGDEKKGSEHHFSPKNVIRESEAPSYFGFQSRARGLISSARYVRRGGKKKKKILETSGRRRRREQEFTPGEENEKNGNLKSAAGQTGSWQKGKKKNQ